MRVCMRMEINERMNDWFSGSLTVVGLFYAENTIVKFLPPLQKYIFITILTGKDFLLCGNIDILRANILIISENLQKLYSNS